MEWLKELHDQEKERGKKKSASPSCGKGGGRFRNVPQRAEPTQQDVGAGSTSSVQTALTKQ